MKKQLLLSLVVLMCMAPLVFAEGSAEADMASELRVGGATIGGT